MTHLLRIDSSSRFTGSHSRQLADYFQQTWLAAYPQDRVVVRDLVKTPLPHISDTTIAGFYTPPEQQTPAMKDAVQLSDKLVDELQTADILLLSVPIYNFSIPSALKAWIDQIARIGKTFAYDGTNFTGLLTVKRAYIICTYGSEGYIDDGAFASFNFVEPYLRSLFGFLGITEIQFFHLQGTTKDEATVIANTEKAQKAIAHQLTMNSTSVNSY